MDGLDKDKYSDSDKQAVISRYIFEYIAKDVLAPATKRHTEWYENHALLLRYLYSIGFYSAVDDDRNREADGLEVRWHWPFYTNHPMVRDILGSKSITVLEVLVGIAQRLNPLIFGSATEEEPPVDLSFRVLMRNLGLDDLDNFVWLDGGNEVAETIVTRFLERNYDGVYFSNGSLFPISEDINEDCRDDEKIDFRTMPIWSQMQYFSL